MELKYILTVDDKGTAVVKNFESTAKNSYNSVGTSAASAKSQIEGTTTAINNQSTALNANSKSTQNLTSWIKEQRAEDKQRNFLINETKGSLIALTSALTLVNTAGNSSNETMRSLSNTLGTGIAAFQGFEFALSGIARLVPALAGLGGPVGLAVAAVGAIGVTAFTSIAESESKAAKETEEFNKKFSSLLRQLTVIPELQSFDDIRNNVKTTQSDLDNLIKKEKELQDELGASAIPITDILKYKEIYDIQDQIGAKQHDLVNLRLQEKIELREIIDNSRTLISKLYPEGASIANKMRELKESDKKLTEIINRLRSEGKGNEADMLELLKEQSATKQELVDVTKRLKDNYQSQFIQNEASLKLDLQQENSILKRIELQKQFNIERSKEKERLEIKELDLNRVTVPKTEAEINNNKRIEEQKNVIRNRYAAERFAEEKDSEVSIYNYKINIEKLKSDLILKSQQAVIYSQKSMNMFFYEQDLQAYYRTGVAKEIIDFKRSNKSIDLAIKEAEAKKNAELAAIGRDTTLDPQVAALKKQEIENNYTAFMQNQVVARANLLVGYYNSESNLSSTIKRDLMNDEEKRTTDIQTELDTRLQLLQEYFQNCIMSEEDYAKAVSDAQDVATAKRKAALESEFDWKQEAYERTGEVLRNVENIVTESFVFNSNRRMEWIDYYKDKAVQSNNKIKNDRVNAIDAELKKENISNTRRKALTAEREAIEEETRQKNLKLENEAAKKKYDIEVSQFETQKYFKIAEIVMNTAQALIRGYADLGPIGGAIFSGFIAALGATQVGLVASQAPPPPPVEKFHDGGSFMVTGDSSKETFIKVRGGEAGIIRTEKQQEQFANASQPVNVYINFNSPVPHAEWVKKSVEEGMRKTGLPVNKYFVNNSKVVSF